MNKQNTLIPALFLIAILFSIEMRFEAFHSGIKSFIQNTQNNSCLFQTESTLKTHYELVSDFKKSCAGKEKINLLYNINSEESFDLANKIVLDHCNKKSIAANPSKNIISCISAKTESI